jgi:hypothetical protein
MTEIYYIFAHLYDDTIRKALSSHSAREVYVTGAGRNLRRTPGNRMWKHVRCALEKRYKMDVSKGTKALTRSELQCTSFLTGYSVDDFHRRERVELDEDRTLTAGECVVLVRKPMPLGFEFYQPPAEQRDTSWVQRFGTEQDALDAFINDQASTTEVSGNARWDRRQMRLHASAFGTSSMPVPRETYVCGNCHTGGHFRQFCQQVGQTEISDAKTLGKKPLPKGIPLSQFTKVDMEQLTMATTAKIPGNVVYHDTDGNWFAHRETGRVG